MMVKTVSCFFFIYTYVCVFKLFRSILKKVAPVDVLRGASVSRVIQNPLPASPKGKQTLWQWSEAVRDPQKNMCSLEKLPVPSVELLRELPIPLRPITKLIRGLPVISNTLTNLLKGCQKLLRNLYEGFLLNIPDINLSAVSQKNLTLKWKRRRNNW